MLASESENDLLQESFSKRLIRPIVSLKFCEKSEEKEPREVLLGLLEGLVRHEVCFECRKKSSQFRNRTLETGYKNINNVPFGRRVQKKKTRIHQIVPIDCEQSEQKIRKGGSVNEHSYLLGGNSDLEF